MNPLSRNIKSFFNPEQFQGWGKQNSYFEGWYFKLVTQNRSHAYAVIPGIAMDEEGKKQAFIQVLDGMQNTAEYHRFDFNDFQAVPGKFEVRVADSFFSAERIKLDLPDFKGELTFTGNKPWPKPWYSPGIMGPYSFVPFMECYHGIVSMDHSIAGWLEKDKTKIDFSNGRGYIEKDWGRSFPSWYIWMQSNHFSKEGISLKSSVANIPWLRSSFTGFIAGLQLHDHLYRFTTYNGTKLTKMDSNEKEVILHFENSRHRLEIIALRNESTPLASPLRGLMDGRIEESMKGKIGVKLFHTKGGELIWEDEGGMAAIEVVGRDDRP
jgi:tocopherol cyclase